MLFGKILGELNYESLALFREAGRNLKDNIDKERVYWTRKIQKYLMNKTSPFEKEFQLNSIKKTPTKTLKKIAFEIWNNPVQPSVFCPPARPLSPLGMIIICGGKLDFTQGPCTPDLLLLIHLKNKTNEIIISKNKDGSTQSNFAALPGHLEICQYILRRLENKVPRDSNNNPYGYNPLHMAACRGQFELYQALSSMTDVKNPSDNYGKTPLHCSARFGHLNICNFIMETLEEKNPPDIHGWTPLHQAAKNGQLEVCQMIIDRTGQCCPIDNFGFTPFIRSAEDGHFAGCRFLLTTTFIDALIKKDVDRIFIHIPFEIIDGCLRWFWTAILCSPKNCFFFFFFFLSIYFFSEGFLFRHEILRF